MRDLAHDVQALRDLAQEWREVSRRNRYDKDRLPRDDDPGPHMTAIQLEWAAREIEKLREKAQAVVDEHMRVYKAMGSHSAMGQLSEALTATQQDAEQIKLPPSRYSEGDDGALFVRAEDDPRTQQDAQPPRAADLHPKVLEWTRRHHPERLRPEDRTAQQDAEQDDG